MSSHTKAKPAGPSAREEQIRSYEDLEIGDGSTASREFLRVTFDDASESERSEVRSQLEKYGKLDTLGMFLIIKRLEGFASWPAGIPCRDSSLG